MIEVAQSGHGDPLTFEVTVREAGSASRHQVTMSLSDAAKLCGGCPPGRCVEAAFRFLLDREPKEAILARFDVSVIGRYFSEFETKLPEYIGRTTRGG